MALVDREQMTDATGAVHLYRPVPDNAPGVPPEYPHPDAAHQARASGRGIHPCTHLHPLADQLAYYEERGEEPDMPVDGDQTARWRALQCWDDQTGRQPDRKLFSGSDPCENPDCPHPQPHAAGQWFSDHWPRFRDIAHALYPEGRVPWPLGYRGPRIYSGGWQQWQPFKDYAAETACTYCTPPTPARCRDSRGGMFCTRDTGHSGDHVACGDTRHELDAWPAAPATPEPEQLDMLAYLEEMTS